MLDHIQKVSTSNTVNTSNTCQIENIPWKDRHPSVILCVKKVKDIWGKVDHKRTIIIETKDGRKFTAAISKDLVGLIQPRQKIQLWYDFDSRGKGITVLCIKEIK